MTSKLPEKITERSNTNEHRKDFVSVVKMFVLKHVECCNVEDYWVQTMAEEDMKAVIECEKIPLGCSTDCR